MSLEEGVICGNAKCRTTIFDDVDARGKRLPCPACGSTTRGYGVAFREEVKLGERLETVAYDLRGAWADTATTSAGDVVASSGSNLRAGVYQRSGSADERSTTRDEELHAGRAIARVLSQEDRYAWLASHVGGDGGAADVRLEQQRDRGSTPSQDVQVTHFDTTAIRELNRDKQIIATSEPVKVLDQLIVDALTRKGTNKYPSDVRQSLFLALLSPLPIASLTADRIRAAVARIEHGYREVWLVDPDVAVRL